MSYPAFFTTGDLYPSVVDFYFLCPDIPPELGENPRFQSARVQLAAAWRRTLIRDLTFCIACELRHVTSKKTLSGLPLRDLLKSKLGERAGLWYDRWCSYAPGAIFAIKAEQENEDYSYVLSANTTNASDRIKSYQGGILAQEMYAISLAAICSIAFDPHYVSWPGAFGGSAWQNIAETVESLRTENKLSKVIELIDKAFSLHHNTGTAFNKNYVWQDSEKILDFLNWRFGAKSSWSLVGMISQQLTSMLRDTKVYRQSFIYPSRAYEPGLQPKTNLTVMLNGVSIPVKVTRTVTTDGTYQSVLLSTINKSPEKQIGKKMVPLNGLVLSMDELAESMESCVEPFVTQPLTKQQKIEKAKEEQKNEEQEAPAEPALLTVLAADIYSMLENNLQTTKPGLTLGTFLTNPVRFQIKGGTKPLRLFFKMPNEDILVVSHSFAAHQTEPIVGSMLFNLEVSKKKNYGRSKAQVVKYIIETLLVEVLPK